MVYKKRDVPRKFLRCIGSVAYCARSGFTIVEILVAISIWTIFVALTAASVMQFKPHVRIDATAQEFHSQLLFARNLAISGMVYADQDSNGDPEVPNGYGVRFNTQLVPATSWIFGDLYDWPALLVGNFQYDVDINGIPEKTTFQDITLHDEVLVTLTEETPGSGVLTLPIDIVFETPDGNMTYYYNGVLQDTPTEMNMIKFVFYFADDPAITQTLIIERETNQIYIEAQ